MSTDPAIVAKLGQLLTAIRGFDDPRRAVEQWKQAYRLLQKTDLAPGGFAGVVGMRDVAGLAGLIERLDAPEAAATTPEEIPDADTCRKAMQAFRRRLELTVLDEESTLGRSPLSKGRDGRAAAAIVPPDEWPDAVWRELVRQGKLRYIGKGFYELVKT
jgi:hypothetical protein